MYMQFACVANSMHFYLFVFLSLIVVLVSMALVKMWTLQCGYTIEISTTNHPSEKCAIL